MRNLIVCCDGTWSTPDNTDDGVLAPTNVFKFYGAIDQNVDTDEVQKVYYHPGVGTDGGLFRRLTGGALGVGLRDNIKSAYKWLSVEYRSGDKIILVGFSRGAFTVRSLVGMISACGLLDLSSNSLKEKTIWSRVNEVFDNYKQKEQNRESLKHLNFHNAKKGEEGKGKTPIHFLGVWDTVGSLGIPDDLGILNLLDRPSAHSFHDTKLSAIVHCARHALAIDEWRHTFRPTLWTDLDNNRDVKQTWFLGTHSNVGGGYKEPELSNIALSWMIEEASKKGVKFRENVMNQIQPDNPLGLLHNSVQGIYKALKTYPRNIPCMSASNNTELFHPSVIQRHKEPPLSQPEYWNTKRLNQVGDKLSLDVFAAQKWNKTGLFVRAGEKYKFSAKGEWLDSSIESSAGGTADGKFQFAEIAHIGANILGGAENLFKKLTGNYETDFWYTRRRGDMNWFSLVGYIASSSIELKDRYINIGKGNDVPVSGDGYLYCFANDAWQTYDNNKGSVRLTIERLI